MQLHKSTAKKSKVLNDPRYMCRLTDELNTIVDRSTKNEFLFSELEALIGESFAKQFFASCSGCGNIEDYMVKFDGSEDCEFLCKSCLQKGLSLLP